MIRIILLVLLSEAITVIGQVLYKKSANALETYNLKDKDAHLRFLSEIFKQVADGALNRQREKHGPRNVALGRSEDTRLNSSH